MVLINSILNAGTRHSNSFSERRNIRLSNFISLMIASALLMIILFRLATKGFQLWFYLPLFIDLALYFSLIALNSIDKTVLSRILLCWIPAFILIYNLKIILVNSPVPETSHYVGIRIFQLAFACIPFLVFNFSDWIKTLTGVSVPLLAIVMFDPILTWMGVGYEYLGLSEESYHYNLIRTCIGFFILSTSFIFLKRVIEKQEAVNSNLIEELEKKNEIIQQQAATELGQLNQQLLLNLEESTKREFILKESQTIAKVGSWEYHLADKKMYWSDQMYEIFNVHKSFDFMNPKVNTLLLPGSEDLMRQSFHTLLKDALPIDLTIKTTTPTNSAKWIRIVGYPTASNDQITGASGIVHDITYFKEAEERILKMENNYRSLFEQASDSIMVTDLNGNFTDVNSSMCSMLGYTRDELLQLNILDIYEPEQLKTNPVRFSEILAGAQFTNERIMLHKNGSKIPVEMSVKKLGEYNFMAIARNISERKDTAQKLLQANYLLNERIKERTILYHVSRLLNEEHKSLPDIFQEITGIVPDGFQFPEICACRLRVFDNEYASSNFKESTHKLSEVLEIDHVPIGVLEVVYIEPTSDKAEEAFFKEEKNLIRVIAEMLRIFIIRKQGEDELNKAQANLQATINNTEIMIWSVDRNFKLLTFNEPFFRFSQEYHKIDIKKGHSHRDVLNEEQSRKWDERYMRALAGESVVLEETSQGFDFRLSLSPIIEKGKIAGVSVIADNVTDRNIRNRDLTEANKKIGELKVMALRSVMNPHFIFNVLNSIQFFIASNDRRNAINYLSTFSKLVRTVLNQSVAEKIKLSEELDMLRNYIELEKVRFENKFNYTIEVDKDIEDDTVYIPSLLTQPYIENAILHGLYNKQGEGQLIIRIKSDEDYLNFEIEDNGIGREAAAKLKSKGQPEHKSMGTKLTEERLKLINEQSGVDVTFTDLFEGDAPAGTRVNIKIKTY